MRCESIFYGFCFLLYISQKPFNLSALKRPTETKIGQILIHFRGGRYQNTSKTIYFTR